MSFNPGTGGVSNLSSNNDVALSNPATDDVLTFDSTSAKWKNKVSRGAIDARDYIMAGDLDLTAARDAAIAQGKTVIKLTADRIWNVPSGKGYVNADATTSALNIDAYGATINVEDRFLDFAASGTAASLQRSVIFGGRFIGPGGAAGSRTGTFAYMTDTGGVRFLGGIELLDFGLAFHHRNYNAWSESFLADGVRVISCDRLAQFDPASVTGGGGTASFSRTFYKNIFFSGGSGNVVYQSDGSGVYDSFFEIRGNLAPEVTDMIRLAGTQSGTTFDIRVEDASNTAHNLFDASASRTNKPRLRPYPVLRNSISLLTGATYEATFDTGEFAPPFQTVTVPGGGAVELTSLAEVRGAFRLYIVGTGAQALPVAIVDLVKANNADAATIQTFPNPIAADGAGQVLSVEWNGGHRPALRLTGGTSTNRALTVYCQGLGPSAGWHTSGTKV